MQIGKIAMIGAGTIGRQLAAFFVSQGVRISIFDVNAQNARLAFVYAKKFARLRAREKLSKLKNVERGIEMLRIHKTLAEAVHDADYIQESIFEDLTEKVNVLSQIEDHALKGAIIGSSSGTLLPSDLQSRLRRPGRFMVVHPTVPAYLAPVLEIVPGAKTDSKLVKKVAAFYKVQGKVPIVLNKEICGYVSNRLFFVMWREMMDLIGSNIISSDAVDLLFCNDLEWWWGTGIGPILKTHLHGGSGERGGIDSAFQYYSTVLPGIWKSAAKWTRMPKKIQTLVSRQVRTMDAVRKMHPYEIFGTRDMRLIQYSKKFKHRQLSKFYLNNSSR